MHIQSIKEMVEYRKVIEIGALSASMLLLTDEDLNDLEKAKNILTKDLDAFREELL